VWGVVFCAVALKVRSRTREAGFLHLDSPMNGLDEAILRNFTPVADT
jgi:hypothetical protein